MPGSEADLLHKLKWSFPWLVRYPLWRVRNLVFTGGQREGLTHIIFVIADHFEPGVGGQAFRPVERWCRLAAGDLDFVFSRVALPYMNVHETLFEIRRVLKRGGMLWLVLHPYSIVLKELVQSISQLKIKRAAVCLYVITNGMVLNLLGREFHLPFRKDYYESFQTIKGISRLLRKAGFEEIKAERNGFFVATARKVQ